MSNGGQRRRTARTSASISSETGLGGCSLMVNIVTNLFVVKRHGECFRFRAIMVIDFRTYIQQPLYKDPLNPS